MPVYSDFDLFEICGSEIKESRNDRKLCFNVLEVILNRAEKTLSPDDRLTGQKHFVPAICFADTCLDECDLRCVLNYSRRVSSPSQTSFCHNTFLTTWHRGSGRD